MHRNSEKKPGCCFSDKVKRYFSGRRCHKCRDLVSPLSQNGHLGRVKICKITGDRKICAHMAAIGVYPGVEADVLCAESNQRCILKVHGGTISLDADLSAHIFVTSL